MVVTPVAKEEVVEIQDPSSKLWFDEDTEIPAQAPADLLPENFDVLVNEVAAMRERLSDHFTFKEWFATRVGAIVKLRSRFPKRGSHDKVVVQVAGHDPDEVTWEEFVEKYLGISTQYLNRLIREAIKGRGDGTKEEKPNPKDLLIRRLQEEVRSLKSQVAAWGGSPTEGKVSVEAAGAPQPGEPAEAAAADEAQAWRVVIAYFREYGTAPAAFADQLRSLLREFGLTRKISIEEI